MQVPHIKKETERNFEYRTEIHSFISHESFFRDFGLFSQSKFATIKGGRNKDRERENALQQRIWRFYLLVLGRQFCLCPEISKSRAQFCKCLPRTREHSLHFLSLLCVSEAGNCGTTAEWEQSLAMRLLSWLETRQCLGRFPHTTPT